MGVCCSGDPNIDSLILTQMDQMKIRSIPLIDIKPIIYENQSSIKGFDLTTLSQESLALYKRTLKTISYDSFIKTASENFYNQTEAFQANYFILLHQKSKSKRSVVFSYLIPLAKDTDDEKMKYFIASFYSLNDMTQMTYSEVKAVVMEYVKNTLTLPLLAIKQTIEDKGLKESINDVIEQMYNDKNIGLFTECLFEAFERRLNAEKTENNEDEVNESNDNDNEASQLGSALNNNNRRKLVLWSERDLKEQIEIHKNYLFDYLLLKEAYNKTISPN